MPYTSRPYVLHEASYRQLLDLQPNLAVLPWGATEAHNYHLPYGTDVIEATALGEAAVGRANEQGARCILLPTVPFGNNNQQLTQVVTITMRSRTQQAVLHDVADSLLRQGIDRLLILNFHGGNEFKQMIADIMLDLPIFIMQVHGWQTDPRINDVLEIKGGTHADEMETSLVMHIAPDWVKLEDADAGVPRDFTIKELGDVPGVYIPQDWAMATASSGVGDPSKSTAEKGERILEMLTDALVPMLVALSQAQRGEYPYFIRTWPS